MKHTSIIKHADKLSLVRMCQKRERDGYECVKPIHVINNYTTREFERDGGFVGFKQTYEDLMYCAVYEKEG